MDRLSGYLLAFATVCTATGVRYAMQHQLEDRNRMLLFIPAVLISVWYGGVGPGVFALLFSTFMCCWILIPPLNEINVGDRVDQIGLLIFLMVGAGVIALAQRERQEKRKRELAQQALEELNSSLEARVMERTKALEFANQELEGFCYSVSHDLRTPSRAISGNIHILIEDYGDCLEPPVQEKLTRISDAAVKLGDLLDALLTYARLAKAELARDRVDLGALVTAEAKSWTEKRGVHVSALFAERIEVVGDPAQLRTAVEALVSNAAVYSKPGKHVQLWVSAEAGERQVTIQFKDNGIGFDMQYLHKIFLPFERLHRDAEYPGVGMGLAKVARIAQRHGGNVWAESTEGEGSCFFLRLGGQP